MKRLDAVPEAAVPEAAVPEAVRGFTSILLSIVVVLIYSSYQSEDLGKKDTSYQP